jgi:hypothetical protein
VDGVHALPGHGGYQVARRHGHQRWASRNSGRQPPRSQSAALADPMG